MGRPRAGTHSVPTPTRILDAAEVVFGASAYAQARLADIARDAGVRRPSLLYHFASKEALHGAVVDRLFTDLLTRFGAVSGSDIGAAETIDELFVTWVGFVDERPAFAPIVLRGIIDGHGTVREHLQQRLVPLLDHVEAGLRQAGVAPANLTVRGALMQIGSDSLVRAASGPLRGPLWGDEDPMVGVRRMFLLPNT
jgi:AcrR family transcriptional regulator